jgi:hypothetical protein
MRSASSSLALEETYRLNGWPRCTPVTTQSFSDVTIPVASHPAIGSPTTVASLLMAYQVHAMANGLFVPVVVEASEKLKVTVASPVLFTFMATESTTQRATI